MLATLGGFGRMEDQMASKILFPGAKPSVQAADTVNEAGGAAYQMTPKMALAQLAVTGCLSNTYYVSDKMQLEAVLNAAVACDPEYVAKVALYAHEKGFMKDMPAVLAAYLAAMNGALLEPIFPRVINNGKMLRNFVQVIRSGALGRKSFGTRPKRMIQSWFESRKDGVVFTNSTGNDPSMADVIKLIRPVPGTVERSALYAYLLGKDKFKFQGQELVTSEHVPEEVKSFLAFKADPAKVAVPEKGVPFEMLVGVEGITEKGWKQLAERATWTQLRMNLNTFLRHGVFSDKRLTKKLADKLGSAEEVAKAHCFPYQLLAAYKNVGTEMPTEITLALQDALEAATKNIPVFAGSVVICPDVSGSMSAYVTGRQGSKTPSKVTCIDVAALVAASVLRTNQTARVIPFEQSVVGVKVNPRDSVMTNAQKLSSIGGGGTNCSAPLALLNKENAAPDVVIFISDYESWVDREYGHGTGMLTEWQQIVKRNPKAKLICIDVTPSSTHQVPSRPGILQVGGFSDEVFNVIGAFVSGDASSWVASIESYK